MARISALWRIDAFFDGPPAVDHDTRVIVISWLMSLLADTEPPEAVAITDPRLGTVYRAIVAGTDVEITYRLMATGSPRLLEVRRVR